MPKCPSASIVINMNTNMEKRRDDWTPFVRGIHGEALTLSSMKAFSRRCQLYSKQ